MEFENFLNRFNSKKDENSPFKIVYRVVSNKPENIKLLQELKSDRNPTVNKFIDRLSPIFLMQKEKSLPTYLVNEAIDEYYEELRNFYVEKKTKAAQQRFDESPPDFGESLLDYARKILYLKCLEIDPKDMKRDDSAPGWYMFSNDCPVLKACKVLGLDTRVVCKKVFHKQYQAFLIEISSIYNKGKKVQEEKTIKFDRDYTTIRGLHSDSQYCREKLEETEHKIQI